MAKGASLHMERLLTIRRLKGGRRRIYLRDARSLPPVPWHTYIIQFSRCLVALNRFIALQEFMILNKEQVAPRSEPARLRNEMAALCFLIGISYEWSLPIIELDKSGLPGHLTKEGRKHWRRVLWSASRWNRWSGQVKRLRDKVGFHADAGVIRKGLRKALGPRKQRWLLISEGTDDTFRNNHFRGADELLLSGLGLRKASMRKFIIQLAKDRERVPNDLLEAMMGVEVPA